MKFNTDSPFFRFLGTFGRFVCLNIVFVITCIPVITIGQSIVALYGSVFKYINEEDQSLVHNYFQAFKNSFLVDTIYYLLTSIFAAVLAFVIYFWYKVNSGWWTWVIVGLLAIVAIAFLFTLFYLYPLLARYTQKGKQVIQNAFLLSIANFYITLAILAINIASLALVYFSSTFRALFAVFGIAFVAYCKGLLLMKAFKKYEYDK